MESGASGVSINIKEIPSFYGRNAFSYLSNTNDDYHFRLRNNYSVKDAREYYGKNHWSSLTDQSYVTQILDYRKYADAHPEWYHFSKEHLEIYPQICYTKGLYDTEQGGFFDTFVKNLIENFIVPESDKTFFMLGISDNEYPCDCERCCEDAEKYGRSGLSIRFVNRVARAVERWRQKNCPEREIYLVSFAYQYDTEPPVKEVNGSFEPLDESVVADDNVIIRYAPIDANYLYPLCDKEHNLKTSKELAGWSKIAKHIAVWDYRQDFHCHAFPFPALLTGEENINIYYEYGVCDIFSQAQRWCDGAPSFVLADNFARARKFWNIHENYTEKFYEFIDAYYKDCAPFICEYIEKLKEFWRKLPERGYKGYVHDGMIRRPYYFRKEEIDEWEVILCRAIKKARDIKDKELSEKLVARVEPLTIFYKLSRLNCFALQQDENEARGLLNELKLLCAKYNFTYFATREPMQMYFDETEKVLSGKTKIEERYIKYRNRGCKY